LAESPEILSAFILAIRNRCLNFPNRNIPWDPYKMKKTTIPTLLLTGLIIALCLGCKKNDQANNGFFSEYSSRNFEMGFSTWPYSPTTESVDTTYLFIEYNADLYSEHIDSKIPWNAWINTLPLPTEFTLDIAGRASRRIENLKLALSVSLLNSARDDLAFDYDETIPYYNSLNDIEIEDAYFKHIEYITTQLNPDYLILAIEVNELLIHAPEKWDAYKSLMSKIRERIKERFPLLQISESMTLHNLYMADVTNPVEYVGEIVDYANNLDFVAISFYPFFKGLQAKHEFQAAFDFLHQKIQKPIAFSETSHLSEDLAVESYQLFIPGNENEQKEYLETLLVNAQKYDYEYLIWWAHRDYDALWETFPPEIRDLGKLWLSTGLINEDGRTKKAFASWKSAYSKPTNPPVISQ
jgi:hypothetical protein